MFADRRDAGRQLGRRLAAGALGDPRLVLALPRGGVPVAFEVAAALDAVLHVLLVRKLGVPGREELAMGAIAAGGVRVLDDEIVKGIGQWSIDEVAARELIELKRREALYRAGHPAPDLRGRTVIVVDDGLATGLTMQAAVTALRRQAPTSVIIAAPVGAPQTCARLREHADEVICLRGPEPFNAVGAWYEDFSQTSDEEVCALLQEARYARARAR